jgi:hypothetical protein
MTTMVTREWSFSMMQVHDGQCGLCTHFGESHPDQPQLIQIRTKHEAPETFVDKCGHPQHAALDLLVTPISGCAGFAPVQRADA